MKNKSILLLLLISIIFTSNAQNPSFYECENFDREFVSDNKVDTISSAENNSNIHFENTNNTRVPVGSKVLNYRQFGYGVQLTPMMESIGFAVTNYNGTSDIPFLMQSEDWDLIIFQIHGNPISAGDSNLIANYIAAGGKVIMAYFDLENNPILRSAFGVSNTISYNDPIPVSVWDENHPIFNTPNAITSLPLGVGGITDDDGDRMEPAVGATALGGFVPTPTVNEAAIVLGNNNSTFFHGFSSIELISSFYIYLIENEIKFLFSVQQNDNLLRACVDFVDGDIYTDTGGPAGNYSASENSSLEFVSVPDETITITFIAFDLEADTNTGCLDTLTVQGDSNGGDGIYSGDSNDGGTGLSCIDGTDGSGNPILGPFTSNVGGSLVFTFNSNGVNEQSGWTAIISLSGSCIPLDNVIVQQDLVLDACFDFEGGETFTDSGASFGLYSENENSIIQFCTQNNEVVTIDFAYFETELNVDTLTISGSAGSDGVYSGINSPGTVTSEVGGCLAFHFESNATSNLAGWSADVLYSGDCILTEIIQQNAVLNACQDFEGGELFTDSGGTVSDYSNDESSTIQFCAEAGETVSFNFLNFDIEPSFDGLTISGSDGSDGTYDGTNSPGVVTSALGGCLSFTFISDESVVRSGWSAMLSYSGGCTLGINNIIGKEQIRLAPNPASVQVTIFANSSTQLEQATIFDVSGKLIKKIDLKILGTNKTLDISKLPSGVYFIRILSNSQVSVKRLIID